MDGRHLFPLKCSSVDRQCQRGPLEVTLCLCQAHWACWAAGLSLGLLPVHRRCSPTVRVRVRGGTRCTLLPERST